MASTSVLKCFKVLVNENASLIVSNPTIFDLTWTWPFSNSSIFETRAIGWNMVILDNVEGYFKAFNPIFNSFYELDILFTINFPQYQYQTSNIVIIMIMIKVQSLIIMYGTKIMIFLLYYYLYIFAKRKSYFWMIINRYDYDYGIVRKVVYKHFNDIYNLLSKVFKIHDYMYNGWCRIRWNIKNTCTKTKIINNAIAGIFVTNLNFIAVNINCVIIYRYCIIIYQSLQLANYKFINTWIYTYYILITRKKRLIL